MPAVERFVVKSYGERPILKGNGFDGIPVGDTREEAQRFVDWLNSILLGASRDSFAEQFAIREGAMVFYEDSYFDARPAEDSRATRKAFCAGFGRGWDAAKEKR